MKRRYSIAFPADLYAAVVEAAASGVKQAPRTRMGSASSVIAGVLENRFGKRNRTPLPLWEGPRAGWINVSVFLDPQIWRRAEAEAERQHGPFEDQRRRALPRVIVGLVAERFARPVKDAA